MDEIKEQMDALMEEQRNLLSTMRQLDPLSDDYKKLQISIAKNAEMISDLNKKYHQEDYDYLDHALKEREMEAREKELKMKKFEWVEDLAGSIAKTVASGAVTAAIIKLIYTAEQEQLMPNNKVSMATKFLKGPKI